MLNVRAQNLIFVIWIAHAYFTRQAHDGRMEDDFTRTLASLKEVLVVFNERRRIVQFLSSSISSQENKNLLEAVRDTFVDILEYRNVYFC